MKAMFAADDKVFAKVRGYPYWPARIVGAVDESVPYSKLKYEIVFYGTGEKAVVKGDDVQPFLKKRFELGKPRKQKAFNDAMAEIESEFSPEELAKGDSDLESGTDKSRKISGRPSKRSAPETPDSDHAKSSGSESKPKSKKRSNVPEEDNSLHTTRSGKKTNNMEQNVDNATGSRSTARCLIQCSKRYYLDMILKFELQGETVSIPLDLNRPIMTCPKSIMEWQKLVTVKASSLRDDVLAGSLTLNGAIEEMGRYTKKLNTDKRNDFRENDRQFAELRTEAKLLQLDVKIKASLTLSRAKPIDACRFIDDLAALPISPLMLKKHPQIIETFKRLMRYVGNMSVWNLSSEKKDEFAAEALAVRNKSEAIMNKFMRLLDVTDRNTFYVQYSNQLREFARATENLSQEEFFALTVDPTLE